jgi:hypothetical protein
VVGLALGPGAAEVGGGGVGGGVDRRAVEGLAVLVDVAEVVAPIEKHTERRTGAVSTVSHRERGIDNCLCHSLILACIRS